MKIMENYWLGRAYWYTEYHYFEYDDFCIVRNESRQLTPYFTGDLSYGDLYRIDEMHKSEYESFYHGLLIYFRTARRV